MNFIDNLAKLIPIIIEVFIKKHIFVSPYLLN